MAVSEPDAKKLETLLAKSIVSSDSRVRAAAARVINVRKVTSLLDHVRARLDVERDGAAAREEIRAIVMLGGIRDLDRALYASNRFEGALDNAAALAAAHLGQPGLDSYFTRLTKRQVDTGSFFVTALWGRGEAAPGIARRLLAENKEGFQKFLFSVEREPDELLDTSVFTAALADSDADTRTEMIWYLVNRAVTPGEAPFDPQVKQAVAKLQDTGDDADYRVGLELLRRVLGQPRTAWGDFRRLLGTNRLPQFRIFLAPKKLMDFIAPSDKVLIFNGITIPDRQVDANVRPLPFVVPSLMPNDVASSVMSATGCTGGWFGEAMVRVDKGGRVTGSSLEFVKADAACLKALQTLIDLSIVDNATVAAAFETSRMSMVQLPSVTPCLDEGIVLHEGVRIFGFELRMPRLVKRVDPQVPNAPHKAGESLVEIVITKQGCVRSARVVRSLDRPTDEAVLRAVDQWQFEPAHYDNGPVEITMIMKVPVK